jgi:hypothetical protein
MATIADTQEQKRVDAGVLLPIIGLVPSKMDSLVEREAQPLIFSERDFDMIAEMIDSPPAPTPELVAAMRDYERLRDESPGGNW